MKYESGYVDQRKDRKGQPWVGHLKYRDEATGRWRQVSKTFDPATVNTERKATKALEEWRAQKEVEAATAPKLIPEASTTVGDYVSAYVDDLEASGSVERRTASDYRTATRHIAAGLKGVSMADLTATRIQKWENGLTADGLAPATVIKIHRLLSAACKHAVNVDVLTKNPCNAVKTPKRKAPSPNALTAEGYARLAATLDAMEPSPVITAATIALHTGLRQGECCGLRWRDYDAEAATISVRESIGRASGTNYSKEPKTKSSIRDVPVSPQLANALERRRAVMEKELEEYGVTLTADEFGALYILGYVDGRYHSPSLIGRGWKALSGAFGLTGTQGRQISFHDLRHSFATRAIAAGADVKSVAAVLGHGNVAITLNTYADSEPEGKRRASDLVAKAIADQGEVELYAELASADD